MLRRSRETYLRLMLRDRRSRVELNGILLGFALRVTMRLAEEREATRCRMALAARRWRIA